MIQNISNQPTPQNSDELSTQLEPGYCCICQKPLRITLFQKNQSFSYFYLISKAKTDHCNVNKYIVFICKNCEIESIKGDNQYKPQLQIFTNYLQHKKFIINQLGEKSQANPDQLSFSFKRNESQAACGYLSNQNNLCENCNKLEEQFEKYDKSFIIYASSTYKRALILAKELALEQFQEDQSLYQQYKNRFEQSKDNQEKFYLKKKLEKILGKYKNNNPINKS